jgi:hypothetical protein
MEVGAHPNDCGNVAIIEGTKPGMEFINPGCCSRLVVQIDGLQGPPIHQHQFNRYQELTATAQDSYVP